jgi:hypothetical protein
MSMISTEAFRSIKSIAIFPQNNNRERGQSQQCYSKIGVGFGKEKLWYLTEKS